METYKLGNKTLEIIQDEHPESPRSWDNLGTFAFSHKRYNFGDEKKIEKLIGSRDSEAIQKFAHRKDVIALPVYMYDHSGTTFRSSRQGKNPFHCPWDSGLIGWVVVTKKQVREEYGWKVITKTRLEKILTYLENEVETYDQYSTGDVYGFRILEDDNENITNSCWGFYGSDVRTNGILDHIGDEWKTLFPTKETQPATV